MRGDAARAIGDAATGDAAGETTTGASTVELVVISSTLPEVLVAWKLALPPPS